MAKCWGCNGRGDNNGDPYDFESCETCDGTGSTDKLPPFVQLPHRSLCRLVTRESPLECSCDAG